MYPIQFYFFRFNRLLNAVGRATSTGFTMTHMGRLLVRKIGSRLNRFHTHVINVVRCKDEGWVVIFLPSCTVVKISVVSHHG